MDNVEQLRFPKLIDINEVARILAVTVRYVRRMVAEGRIEFIKIGHHLRFDEAKVYEYVERQRRPPCGV